MKSSQSNKPALIAGSVVVLGILYSINVFWVQDSSEPEQTASVSLEASTQGSRETTQTPISANVSTAVNTEELIKDEKAKLVESIQAKFGSAIHHRHTQVKAVEKLVRYLKEKYPETWQDELQAYLQEIFPEYADAMIELFQNMELYNQWLIAEKQNLMQMTPQERRDLIWTMRESFFGEAAQEIWAESLKGEKVLNALVQINDDIESGDFNEHGEYFVSALEEAYGESASSVIENRRQEFVDRFLGLEQIQNQLHDMPNGERYAALSEFRRAIGMDEAAVERWTALDQVRDTRRDKGAQYMKEKEDLKASLSEDEYQLAIVDLQETIFGPEAEIIRNEEESGYFRFENRQVIGKN